MNGLFPIIRRKRTPLVVADAPLAVASDVEPVPVVNDECRMTNDEGSPKPEARSEAEAHGE
jgi:hypothetical protein